jgi:hypothetical protein
MNKKQLNTLSTSLNKALSPPSRRKIELSARIIDQVQPLPGILSRAANSEPKHDPPPRKLGRTTAVHEPACHQKAIISGVSSAARLPSNDLHRLPTEWSDFTTPPTKTFLRQRIVRIQRIQDGLTMAEQRVLNYLWESAGKESSTAPRVLTVSQKGISFAARLSVVSVRTNLRSLESKWCIEEMQSFDVTEHLGRTYRVYSFASILDRWRRSGYIWARHTRGVELLKSSNSSRAEESLAPQDSWQESSAAQVSLAGQLSSPPEDSLRSSVQHSEDQRFVAADSVRPADQEDSSAPQFSLAPQDSLPNPDPPDYSTTSIAPRESLPPQVSLGPKESFSLRRSCTHSKTCPANQESLATADSLPFIKKENKQTKQSSTSSTVSLSQFPETLQIFAEFPATRLADDRIVWNMIRQVQINTPDASDAEIADFVRHKGGQIKNPKTSFMACLSAMVVGAMQGHRMSLYRQQKQKEQERREAEQRSKLQEIVQYSEFWLATLDRHLAGQAVHPSTLKDAIGLLQFHLPQLPQVLQERIEAALQRVAKTTGGGVTR